jgi:hypothetical protein
VSSANRHAMLQPPCEQKEHLLASYMEAVRNHYEIVGLLNSVRHQPKTFRDVLGKAKVAHTQCARAGPHWNDIAKRTDLTGGLEPRHFIGWCRLSNPCRTS